MIKNEKKGSVSAVIVNYNAGQLLSECVASCIEQVSEVYIVDNASSDNSLSQVRSIYSNDSRVKIISNSANLGFSVACNMGITRTRSEYLLLLNPDCTLDYNVVPRLYEVLDSELGIGMVGGLLVNVDGTEQAGGRRAVPTPWRSFVRAFGLSRFAHRWPRLFFDFCLHKQPLPDKPVEVEAVSGACMLVKREAVDDVGLLDEKYFLHCEDLDWCMRFRRNGWKILFVPSVKITHALGACGRNRPIFVEWNKHRGMIRFYRKFFRHQYPGVLWWLVAVGVWLRFGMLVTYCSVRRVLKALRLVRA